MDHASQLKLVRTIAESLMGALDACHALYDGLEDNVEATLFMATLGVTLDTAVFVFIRADSSGMDYQDVIDYCTTELGEEMDGTDG